TTATVALTMKAGDFAVWAPSTPHGSMAPRPNKTQRRSIQAIYRPTRLTLWGNSSERLADLHDVASEEKKINDRFNCLISKHAEIHERFRNATESRPCSRSVED